MSLLCLLWFLVFSPQNICAKSFLLLVYKIGWLIISVFSCRMQMLILQIYHLQLLTCLYHFILFLNHIFPHLFLPCFFFLLFFIAITLLRCPPHFCFFIQFLFMYTYVYLIYVYVYLISNRNYIKYTSYSDENYIFFPETKESIPWANSFPTVSSNHISKS